jgi:hypothetical protein
MAKFIEEHPERKAFLVDLWYKYGNKCRLGHINCPDETHYLRMKSKIVLSVKREKFVEIINPNTCKPILDKAGDPCFNKIQEVKKSIVQYQSLPVIIEDDIERWATDYDITKDNLKVIWIQADRAETVAKYQAEYDIRHKVSDRLPLHGRFCGIAKDIYYDAQSVYKIDYFGMTHDFKPFAKVIFNATGNGIFIDLSETLSHLSRNRRHKIIRYACNGKIDDLIDTAIYKAVNGYLS